MTRPPTRKKRNARAKKRSRDVGLGPPPLRKSHARFVAALRGGANNIDAARIAGFSGGDRQLSARASELLARDDVKDALALPAPATKEVKPKDAVMDLWKRLVAGVDEHGVTIRVPLREQLQAAQSLAKHLGMFERNEELKPGEGELVDWDPLLPPDAVIEEYEAFVLEHRKRKMQTRLEDATTEAKTLAEESATAEDKLRATLDRGWKDGGDG